MESTTRVERDDRVGPLESRLETIYTYLEHLKGEALAAIIGALLILVLALTYGFFSQRAQKNEALKLNVSARATNAALSQQIEAVRQENAGLYTTLRNQDLRITDLKDAMRTMKPTLNVHNHQVAPKPKPATAKAKAKPRTTAGSTRGSLGRRYR